MVTTSVAFLRLLDVFGEIDEQMDRSILMAKMHHIVFVHLRRLDTGLLSSSLSCHSRFERSYQ